MSHSKREFIIFQQNSCYLHLIRKPLRDNECANMILRYFFRNNLYFVKGENPLTIYHYPEHGFYLYASTEGIPANALQTLGMEGIVPEVIRPAEGEILQINRDGQR